MKKRVLALATAVCLSMALTACGKEQQYDITESELHSADGQMYEAVDDTQNINDEEASNQKVESNRDEVAEEPEEGLTFEELIKEMEAIVFSGTKLNIDYYINQILDEEQQQEIMDYFMEAKSDNIGDAYDEFEGDYSEEDLRLMRLKLHSKHGN